MSGRESILSIRLFVAFILPNSPVTKKLIEQLSAWREGLFDGNKEILGRSEKRVKNQAVFYYFEMDDKASLGIGVRGIALLESELEELKKIVHLLQMTAVDVIWNNGMIGSERWDLPVNDNVWRPSSEDPDKSTNLWEDIYKALSGLSRFEQWVLMEPLKLSEPIKWSRELGSQPRPTYPKNIEHELSATSTSPSKEMKRALVLLSQLEPIERLTVMPLFFQRN